jgi:hypothetical protein
VVLGTVMGVQERHHPVRVIGYGAALTVVYPVLMQDVVRAPEIAAQSVVHDSHHRGICWCSGLLGGSSVHDGLLLSRLARVTTSFSG